MDSRLRFSVFMLACVVCLLIEEARSQDATKRGCTRPRLRNGRAKVRSRGTVVYYRCRRKYILIGGSFATCVGGAWSSPPPICAAKDCPHPSITRVVSLELSNSGSMATFSCAPGYIMKGPRTAICLGKVWNGTAPHCMGPDGIYGMDCTFENEFRCGWTQDTTDDFDWKETNGETATSDTGPSFDHTLGKGKAGTYLFTESSMPRVPNDTARLMSPVFGEKYSYSCFQFWYHLYGRVGAGELRVYVKPVNKELSELKPRFEVSGNQGNVWKKEMITIEILEAPFQIVMEGKRLNTYFSDIAIDDLKIDRCPPGVDPTSPSATEAVATNSTETASTEEPTNATSSLAKNATTDATSIGTKSATQNVDTSATTVSTKTIGTKAATVPVAKTTAAGVTKATQGNTAVTEATQRVNTAEVTKATQRNTAAALTTPSKGNTAAVTEATKGNTAAVTKATKRNTVAVTVATKGNTEAVTEATKGNTAAVTEATKGNTVAVTVATKRNTAAVTEATKGNTAAVTEATQNVNTAVVTEATQGNTAEVTEARQKGNTAAVTKATQGNTAAVTEATQNGKTASVTVVTRRLGTKSATQNVNTPPATSAPTSVGTKAGTQKPDRSTATKSIPLKVSTPAVTKAATSNFNTPAVTKSATSNVNTPAVTKSGTGIVVYKPTKNQKNTSNAIDDKNIEVDTDGNKVNMFPRTAGVASDNDALSYPATVYVALSIVAAFAVVFVVVGLVGYAVQRRRRPRRESQVEEMKPITSGDTLLEQWLSWRIYETVE
ncbi:zonadhesin-like [Lineus longissimus]|uniref:zonadhesin-like n=1 Tax=Lineus longissimus TaxID=88925 RepID=UPI00315C95B9